MRTVLERLQKFRHESKLGSFAGTTVLENRPSTIGEVQAKVHGSWTHYGGCGKHNSSKGGSKCGWEEGSAKGGATKMNMNLDTVGLIFDFPNSFVKWIPGAGQ